MTAYASEPNNKPEEQFPVIEPKYVVIASACLTVFVLGVWKLCEIVVCVGKAWPW